MQADYIRMPIAMRCTNIYIFAAQLLAACCLLQLHQLIYVLQVYITVKAEVLLYSG